jgi:uncharacterized membrane protein YcaP (DUF421 family)
MGHYPTIALPVELRAALVYVAGLFLVRLADQRFMGKNTVFDVILAIVVGSTLSRAVNGGASLPGTLAAAAVLFAVHWLFALIAFRSPRFGRLVKGDTFVLVEDGEIRWNAMRRAHISEADLAAALRLNGNLGDRREVASARFERSGDISVLLRRPAPSVVDVTVADGVQRVRIELV